MKTPSPTSAPLASLRSLNVIDLSGNLITNTGSLSGLAGFYSLSLADNRIADIAPLATLSNGYHYDYASVDWLETTSTSRRDPPPAVSLPN